MNLFNRSVKVNFVPHAAVIEAAPSPEEVIHAIIEAPAPAPIKEVLKSIPAVLRAVVTKKDDDIGHVIDEDNQNRGYKITDQHGGKGVSCTVIPDEQLPVDTSAPKAEVIVSGPRAAEVHQVAQETLFWDTFAARLRSRGEIVFNDAADLIARKSEFGKGYSTIVDAQSQEEGIVHVTKAGINALIPQGDGTYRVISNNKRFDGQAYVNAEKAKGFLNGRY